GAGAKAGVEVACANTGKVTGTVVIGRFRAEPADPVLFASPPLVGGTGKTGVAFVGIGAQGFGQGVAHVTLHYQDADLRAGTLSPNSLFLAYHAADRWLKPDNLAVLTGAQTVAGDLPVAALNRTPVLALGGDAGARPASLLDLLAADWRPVAALVALALVGPTAVTLLAVRRRPKQP